MFSQAKSATARTNTPLMRAAMHAAIPNMMAKRTSEERILRTGPTRTSVDGLNRVGMRWDS